ncbi:hypothetical protein MMC17_010037 [Xylographa soralifera]|nr:hypothetical protein [Xylographa soralifera]
MAEAVLLGTLPSIITLIDFAQKVVTQIINFTKDVKAVPKTFLNLRAVLPAADLVLRKTASRASAGDLSNETLKVLDPIIKQCHEQVTELNDLLKKLVPIDNASWIRNAGRVISGVSQENKINRIRDSIMQNLQMITNVALVTRLTEEEISSIGSPDKSTSIDSTVKDMIQQLKLPSRYMDQAQSNSQSFNNSSNQFTYFNAPVYQFINTLPTSQVTTALLTGPGEIPKIISGTSSGSINSEFVGSIVSPDSTAGESIAEIQFEAPSTIASSSSKFHEHSIQNSNLRSSFSATLVDVQPSDIHEMPPTEDPSEALKTANAILLFATSNVNKNSSAAKQLYLRAIRHYSVITTNDPVLLVRKYRNLTRAALGLSLVVDEKEKHIGRARFYNQKAYETACNALLSGDKNKIKLDEADIDVRVARILQSRDMPPLAIADFLSNAFDSIPMVRPILVE